MCTSILVVGLPHGRASQLYTTWLPVWTGFRVSSSAFVTGPPALSSFPSTRSQASGIARLPPYVNPCNGPPALTGFPIVHAMASGVDRLPCILRCLHHLAARFVGLPLYIQGDFRHRTDSMCVSMLLPGLPPARASQLNAIWIPAWTGFHVSQNVFIVGPPASSGFPCTPTQAICADKCVCACGSGHWALPSPARLSAHHPTMRPPSQWRQRPCRRPRRR